LSVESSSSQVRLEARIELRNYTRARRQPQVIGKIGGWYPIWGVASVTQYIVGGGAFVLLLTTTWLWAHLGSVGNLLVFIGVPFGLAWTVRRAKVDGRGPIAAIAGLVSHLNARNGTLIAATNPTPPPRMRPAPVRHINDGSWS
jgi:hypothetical protein